MVIVGSRNTINAISPQRKATRPDTLASWSDGGERTHPITAPATAATCTARFRR